MNGLAGCYDRIRKSFSLPSLSPCHTVPPQPMLLAVSPSATDANINTNTKTATVPPTTANTLDWSTLLMVGGASVAALHILALPFVAPGFRKFVLPYVAANKIQLEMLSRACRQSNVKNVVDLGSGDGVVCIHLAKELGIKARGYELNPWLVLWSKASASYHGVGHLCKFHCRDLFKADVSSDDGIVLFVVPSMMKAIEEKLEKEMKENARVYAARFPLETWKANYHEKSPQATSGYNVNQLWVYNHPKAITISK